MRTLPTDFARCKPQTPDVNCRNCRRWWEWPEQTFGELQTFVLTVNSRDEACIYVPISFLEKPKR